MPIKLKPGEVVEGRYRIEAGVHTGNFAISYKSTRLHDNCPAFFKQYLSPTKMSPWYRQYQQQVHAFKARIESDVVCKDICYQFYDIFEHRSSLCMTFEWAENGLDLKAALARPTTTWADRVLYAKVTLYGIKILHKIKIAHLDLKPDNLLLIPDKAISNGYRLKVIDMDQSILVDRPAAWHGHSGYAGTENYLSPEHAQGPNVVPSTASDAFTCGIILAELLCDGSPFASEPDYKKAILSPARPKRAKLRGSFGDSGRDRKIEDLINKMLERDAGSRPTVAEVHEALLAAAPPGSPAGVRLPVPGGRPSLNLGTGGRPIPPGPTGGLPPLPPRLPSPVVPPPLPPPVKTTASPVGTRVLLEYDSPSGPMKVLHVNTELPIGSAQLKDWGPEFGCVSRIQFHLYREGGAWMIRHEGAATNMTLLDGQPLVVPVAVVAGQEVAVGNPAKGIKRVPMRIKLV